ncbi:LacI family DNA-binding transcriptional regulator [Gracilibacillus dipsosauri]|uniref:LacI family transcriptional regulator n=1 Tax=Gracilibacillus dipsosauri TaxID=178340 RepID=A0A317L244_9BACI|nr:substrate-binding domain-containing protein [Gracilibacillus dipsosauri]PWU69566.1 LacI family transcriptional regulator [Gracilibacillus dipsosauri]
MKKITITDVAKHAGVSKSTVSQYLNERYDYMGGETKARIEAAIKELNYSPNFLARSLKQKKTNTIGVIVANILHVFSTQIIRAIQDYCSERNFHVIACNADDDPRKEKQFIEMLQAKQVDGIIVFPTGANKSLYQTLIMTNYPTVFIDRMVSGVGIDTVLLDNEKASKLAIQTFLMQGYQRIAMISPPLLPNITPRMERTTGYKQTITENGLSLRPEYIANVETTNVRDHLRKMLALREPPDAMLALNDLVLVEILHYMKENQLQIPKDLAIIGIDDVTFASVYNPALTTIAQPAFAMGKKAAELLLEKISNITKRREGIVYRFEPKIMRRDSV